MSLQLCLLIWLIVDIGGILEVGFLGPKMSFFLKLLIHVVMLALQEGRTFTNS